MKSLFFESFYGLGDCLYERPFVVEIAKQFDRVYVQTHFPQIYHDQPQDKFVFVKPVPVAAILQTKNARAYSGYIEIHPMDHSVGKYFTFRSCRQFHPEISAGSRFDNYLNHALSNGFQLSSLDFTFSMHDTWKIEAAFFLRYLGHPSIINGRTKYCLFDVPSILSCFPCHARNPHWEVLASLIHEIRKTHVVLALGCQDQKYETLDGVYEWDFDYTRGEINIWTVLAMMQAVDLNIGGPGYFIPASLLTGAKTFIVYGAHEPPHWHIPSWAEHYNLGWIQPDARNNNKMIDHALTKFKTWLASNGSTHQR